VDAGEARSAERAARNELTFQEANEEIESTRRELGIDGRVPYICECADERCTRLVLLSPDEYRGVRAAPRRFVVSAEHASPDGEVVARAGSYTVVEKTGREGDVVDRET